MIAGVGECSFGSGMMSHQLSGLAGVDASHVDLGGVQFTRFKR